MATFGGHRSTTIEGLPLLTRFVADPEGALLMDLAPPADIRAYVADVLGPAYAEGSSARILILASVHDPDVNAVGLELLKRGADYLRINFEDLPTRVTIACPSNPAVAASVVVGRQHVESTSLQVAWARHWRLSPPVPTGHGAPATFLAQEWEATLTSLARSVDCYWVATPEAIRPIPGS